MSANGCPSEYMLDDYLLSARKAEHQAHEHISHCAACRASLATYEREQAAFASHLEPRTRAAVVASLSRPRRHLLFLPRLYLALVTAAAMCVAVIAIDWRSAGPYIGSKGALGVVVYCRRGDAVIEVAPSQTLYEGDMLRFRVTPPDRGYVRIVGVDTKGDVSAYYPPDDGDPVRINGATLLPGSIVLDDSHGSERIVALFSRDPITASTVREAVRSGLQKAGSLAALDTLPIDAEQYSLRIVRGPRP